VLIAAGSAAILRPPAPVGPAGPPGDDPGAGPVPGARSVPGLPGATGSRRWLGAEQGWPARLAVFSVAVYIGYFGAAGGILLLAVLIRILHQSLARTNAVKNVVSGLANAVAGLGFAIFGPVRWAAVVPLAAGFLIGGWTGPKIVRRLPARLMRRLVGCCGLALAAWLGARAYF